MPTNSEKYGPVKLQGPSQLSTELREVHLLTDSKLEVTLCLCEDVQSIYEKKRSSLKKKPKLTYVTGEVTSAPVKTCNPFMKKKRSSLKKNPKLTYVTSEIQKRL